MLVTRKRPASAAQRAAKLARLASMMNTGTRPMPYRRSAFPTEIKYFDVTGAFSIPGTADWLGSEVACSSYIQSDGTTVGAYTDAALIPSAIGAGYGQVNGSKYFLKNLRVRGEVTAATLADSTDAVSARVVRLVLVHDTQPNGAQAQGEDVFTDLGSAAQCNYSFLAMGAGAGGRFRILAERIIVLQPQVASPDNAAGGASTSSLAWETKPFVLNASFRSPLQVCLKANSSTPTVASLSNNNIFMLAHVNSATAVPSLTFASRAFYAD